MQMHLIRDIGQVLKKSVRRRCWNKAVPQTQAKNDHGRHVLVQMLETWQCCKIREAGDATRQFIATKFVCSRVLLALFRLYYGHLELTWSVVDVSMVGVSDKVV